MSEPHQHAVFLVAIAIAAIGAVLDWRKGEIPNWLTLPALALAPFIHVARYRLAKETMEDLLLRRSVLTRRGRSLRGGPASLVSAERNGRR